MQKCERCQENEARVRLDSIVNGRREQHYFCRECAEELLGGQVTGLGNGNGSNGSSDDLFGSFFGNGRAQAGNGAPFGFRPNGGTATAQRTQDKNSKTPTLDQFGRDLFFGNRFV